MWYKILACSVDALPEDMLPTSHRSGRGGRAALTLAARGDSLGTGEQLPPKPQTSRCRAHRTSQPGSARPWDLPERTAAPCLPACLRFLPLDTPAGGQRGLIGTKPCPNTLPGYSKPVLQKHPWEPWQDGVPSSVISLYF